MKKVRLKLIAVLVAMVSVMLMGCSTEFAGEQYDSEKDIAAVSDKYYKIGSVKTSGKGTVKLTSSEFDGRETLLTPKYNTNQEITIELSLTLSAGKAKLVIVNADKSVETIVECTADNCISNATAHSVKVSEGKNYIKVIGVDVKDLEVAVTLK